MDLLKQIFVFKLKLSLEKQRGIGVIFHTRNFKTSERTISDQFICNAKSSFVYHFSWVLKGHWTSITSIFLYLIL